MKSKQSNDDAIAKALKDEELHIELPTKHTAAVMQRINMAKVFKDLLDLEMRAPTEVIKTFKKTKKEEK